MDANILDVILLIIFLIAIIHGFLKGFIGPLLGIISVVVAGVAAWATFEPISQIVPLFQDDPDVRQVATCLTIFVTAVIALTIICGRINRAVKKSTLSEPNRIAGAALSALRLCMIFSFVIRTVYFHPSLMPIFERSLMTPVVLFGGFLTNLFVPSIFTPPSNEKIVEVRQHDGLSIWIDTDITTSGTVHRTMRLTGNAALESLNTPESMLTEPRIWRLRELPSQKGNRTVEAVGTGDRPGQLSWDFSNVHWETHSEGMQNVAVYDEEFRFLDDTATGTAPHFPEQHKGESLKRSLIRELEHLQKELEGRVAVKVAGTLAIPVHHRCHFPHEVESAGGPGARIEGRTVTWDFDLTSEEPVTLTARSTGRGFIARAVWLAFLAGIVGIVLTILHRKYLAGCSRISLGAEPSSTEAWHYNSDSNNDEDALPK